MTSSNRTTAFKGGLLSVGMRWTARLLGLLSTLVLARLLTPADFGLVAMAMIVVGLVDVLLDLGVSAALIQNKSADRHDFDTAWTLRLCQSSLAAIVLIIAAPLVADYFNDSRVVDVLRVIAVTVFVGGLENIGIVMFQKDMEFGRDFRFFFIKRCFGTVVTIIVALVLRSYWALILGSLLGRLIGVGLSYWMHSFRPRFALSRVRQIWTFSQWNMVMSIAGYLSARLDRFVIGRRENASVLGAYTLGDEIASMPTSELLAPLGRVMFPAFVSARNDALEFKRVVLLAFSVQALIGIPAGLGVALVAPEAVPLLLGGQWVSAIPFVQVLGLVGVATALIHSSHYMLLALGRIRTLALYFLIQFFALLSLLVLAFPHADAERIAQARLVIAAVGFVVMQVLAKMAVPEVDLRALFDNAWRPLVGAAVMTAAVLGLAGPVGLDSLLLALTFKVCIGVVTYVTTVAVLWRWSGCPKGAEAYILRSVRQRGA